MFKKASYSTSWYLPFDGLSQTFDLWDPKQNEVEFWCMMHIADRLPDFRGFGKSKSEARREACKVAYNYLDTLVRCSISKDRKKQIRKLLIYFSEAEPLRRESINWKLQFNKNNQTYQMLISICYLILKGLLQTTSDGSTKLMDFLDEQRMCRLYEKFILEYYRKEHPEIKASASQIPWATDDGYIEMLPVMQSDITLKQGAKTLVIDAKYYSHTTQKQYDVNSLHSGNLYQIFTYVKNLDTDNTGNVSGMLLYAKTDELVLPNNNYKMGGNAISVKTLDLDCDFTEIRKQLDSIVFSLFELER